MTTMPFGFILPVFLALWLVIGDRKTALAAWRLKPLSALALILGILILSYINIAVGPIFFNLGALFLSAYCLWLYLRLRGVDQARIAAATLLVAALIFVARNGLLWQVDQFFAYSEAAAMLLALLFAAAAGGYRQSLIAASLGAGAAFFATMLAVGSSSWLPYLNLGILLSGGSWLLLWLSHYFRRRQLTNER
ncbi:MAG: hypothetical protein GX572_06420 [Clostridia bacterium]|nr:hypothetical protein [Clostridia bacterium]